MRLSSFKRANIKGFLFFLVFTAILAILNKLSKSYTTTLHIPIEITDVTIDKTIQDISPQGVDVSITLSGFALLRNAIVKPVLELPFTGLNTTDQSLYVHTLMEAGEPFKKAIHGNFEIEDLSENQIVVTVDQYGQKKVPIIPRLSFTYAGGYNAGKPLELTPDSVLITGAGSRLKDIRELSTISKNYTNITQSVTDEVVLDTTGLGILMEKEALTIAVFQDVTRFTEGNFSIPIQVVNDTIGEVQVFPKNVDVFFNARLDDFESIKPEDFKITCDFSAYREGDTFLPITLTESPDYILSTRLVTKQVRFIIVDQ